jgi:hypothetical protein
MPVWGPNCAPFDIKKRIVRTVIQEVIADIDADAAVIVLVIHWMGGIHTELRLARQRRGQRNSTGPDIIDAVRQLVLIANDDLIVGILNRNKLTTGHGNRWTRERVTSLRSHHKIPVHHSADNETEPWLNLIRAAAHLGISARTLRLLPKLPRSNPFIRSPVPGFSAAPLLTEPLAKPSSNAPGG